MKFSIITVVKNRVNDINKTIKSVLSQDFKNFEYIIIDGKSTDGTSEEILKFKNKILYFRESDKGLYHALNKAYIRCKGQIICHMHAGDIFAKKNILSKVNEKFENKNIDLLSGNLKFTNSKITKAELNSNFSNSKKLSFTIKTSKNNEIITTFFSEYAKPIVKTSKKNIIDKNPKRPTWSKATAQGKRKIISKSNIINRIATK